MIEIIKGKQVIAPAEEYVFNPKKSYQDSITICEPIDTYYAFREVWEILQEQIKNIVPVKYHSKIKLCTERDATSRRTVVWSYKP